MVSWRFDVANVLKHKIIAKNKEGKPGPVQLAAAPGPFFPNK